MRRLLSSFRILITAGPTREPLDPVRYLTNRSSGSLGLTLAGRLTELGARVTIVLGPVSLPVPPKVRVVPVETAREMLAAVRSEIKTSDAFVATAAVSDWRFADVRSQKMKKGAASSMTVRLLKNPDILANAGAFKRKSGKGPVLVGFALETRALEASSRKKLREKNLDLIIGNTPASFGSDRIRPLWIEKSGSLRRFPVMTKKALSSEIGRWLAAALRPS